MRNGDGSIRVDDWPSSPQDVDAPSLQRDVGEEFCPF